MTSQVKRQVIVFRGQIRVGLPKRWQSDHISNIGQSSQVLRQRGEKQFERILSLLCLNWVFFGLVKFPICLNIFINVYTYCHPFRRLNWHKGNMSCATVNSPMFIVFTDISSGWSPDLLSYPDWFLLYFKELNHDDPHKGLIPPSGE